MTTLWQRLGRAVRDRRLEGIGLVFVEAKYFDEERERAESAKAARQKRKADKSLKTKAKRARITGPPLSPSKSVNTASGVLATQVNIGVNHEWAVSTTVATSTSLGQTITGTRGEDVQYDDIADSNPSDEDIDQANDDEDPQVINTVAQVLAATDVDTAHSPDNLIETRKQAYEEYAKGQAGASKALIKRQTQELAPELMDFVNAATRANIGCRRVPIKAFFDTNTACESLTFLDLGSTS